MHESNTLSRRQFLKNAGGAGVALIANPLHLLTFPFRRGEDFTIVEKIPADELRPLEELLEPPEEAFSDDKLRINVSRFPGIAYHLEVKPVPDESMMEGHSLSMGSAFLLDSNGFFISAYHVFDDFLASHWERGQSLMLLYDPKNGIASTTKILAYSKKHDILLGKLDAMPDVSIERTYISRTQSPPLNIVYTPVYGNIGYVADQLGEVLGSCEFQTDASNSQRTVIAHQHQPLPSNFEALELEIRIGRLTTLKYDNGKSPTEEWEQVITGGVVPGNSGSPVFDLQHRLMGVISSKGEFVETDSGHASYYTIFTGPNKLREMIGWYIGHGKSN